MSLSGSDLNATRRGAAGSEIQLTAREVEILEMVAGDFPTGDIADALMVSESTIKTHLRSVNSKLGTRTRAGAACRALMLGLFASVPQHVTEPLCRSGTSGRAA